MALRPERCNMAKAEETNLKNNFMKMVEFTNFLKNF